MLKIFLSVWIFGVFAPNMEGFEYVMHVPSHVTCTYADQSTGGTLVVQVPVIKATFPEKAKKGTGEKFTLMQIHILYRENDTTLKNDSWECPQFESGSIVPPGVMIWKDQGNNQGEKFSLDSNKNSRLISQVTNFEANAHSLRFVYMDLKKLAAKIKVRFLEDDSKIAGTPIHIHIDNYARRIMQDISEYRTVLDSFYFPSNNVKRGLGVDTVLCKQTNMNTSHNNFLCAEQAMFTWCDDMIDFIMPQLLTKCIDKKVVGFLVQIHCSHTPCFGCSTTIAAEREKYGCFKKLFDAIAGEDPYAMHVMCVADQLYSRPAGSMQAEVYKVYKSHDNIPQPYDFTHPTNWEGSNWKPYYMFLRQNPFSLLRQNTAHNEEESA